MTRRDEMLGDLRATGGRPNFGADPAPPPEDDRGGACEDCGSIAGPMTYYPEEDIHACPPCSNGKPEGGVVNVAEEITRGKFDDSIRKVLERNKDQIKRALGVPKEIQGLDELSREDRRIIEEHLGGRDKAREMAHAYGMGAAKYSKACAHNFTATEACAKQQEMDMQLARKLSGLDEITMAETHRLMQETLRWMPKR